MATTSYGALGSKKNLNKLLSGLGKKPVGGSSSSNNKPSSGGSSGGSNPYGQFGSMENLTSFVNSVRNVPDSDVATINKNLRNAGIQNFNYKPTQAVEAQTIADMNNMTPIPFQPMPTADAIEANAVVGSFGTVQDLVNQESSEQTAWNQEIARMQNERSKFAKDFDLGETYQDLQKQAGIPDITKQLQQANLQLAQMQSQYQMTNQELAQQAIPQPFVIGLQNELAKTAAIQIGAQASYVQALQGNLDLANHYVDKIIEMEAKDYERKYNAMTDNLNLAMNFLDRADKKQAQAIQYELDLKKADYSNMLDVKKSSMQNALLNGADSGTIQSIANAQTTEEVYSAAGRFGVDPTVQSQLRTASLQQQLLQQELAANADTNNGYLSDTDIKNIDNSPQGKALKVSADLKIKMNNYQDLVNEKGMALFGKDKAILDNAYKELQLAYKEAANLGVLAGPDMEIIETAVRSATPGIFGNVWNVATGGGGTRKLLANLDQAQTTLNSAAQANLDQLYARNPKYENSLYVDSLIMPFSQDLLKPLEIQQMDRVIGDIPGTNSVSTDLSLDEINPY